MERIIENPVYIDEIYEIDEKDLDKFRNAHEILPTKVDVYEQEVIK